MRFLIQLAFLTGFFILGFLFAHEPFRRALFEPLRDAVPTATDAIERFHEERMRLRHEGEPGTGDKKVESAEPVKPAKTGESAKTARKELAKKSADPRKANAADKSAAKTSGEGKAPRKDSRTARNSDRLTERDRHDLDNLLDDVSAR